MNQARPTHAAAPVAAPETEPSDARVYAVKLPAFEGPLDLLLHLIRANEVDISDIPIAEISAQYLEYLELMRLVDIDFAAEYLVMAATLAHIKSRMLLPSDPEAGDEEGGEDPRAELARRLAEYARFQDAAHDLGTRPLLDRDVFSGTVDPESVPQPEGELDVSLFALLEALRRVLDRLDEATHHEVTLERVSLQDRMLHVMEAFAARGDAALLFEDLLTDGTLTRHRVVMTFLAILELAKIQALKIFQSLGADGQPFGPVRVRLAVAPEPEKLQAAARAAEAAEAPEGEGTDV